MSCLRLKLAKIVLIDIFTAVFNIFFRLQVTRVVCTDCGDQSNAEAVDSEGGGGVKPITIVVVVAALLVLVIGFVIFRSRQQSKSAPAAGYENMSAGHANPAYSPGFDRWYVSLSL